MVPGVTTVQAVVFDMDGLLLDTERLALAAFEQTCTHFTLGDQRAVFNRCVGTSHVRGTEVLREGLGHLVDPAEFRRLWDDRYAEITTRPIPLKTGASELLSTLAQRGIPAAVATSTRTAQAERHLRHTGILDAFATVIGGDQVERGKPHPDIYLKAVAALGAVPAVCLALEDSENGVRAAVAAGLVVFQIPDLIPPSSDLLALGHQVRESLAHVRAELFSA